MLVITRHLKNLCKLCLRPAFGLRTKCDLFNQVTWCPVVVSSQGEQQYVGSGSPLVVVASERFCRILAVGKHCRIWITGGTATAFSGTLSTDYHRNMCLPRLLKIGQIVLEVPYLASWDFYDLFGPTLCSKETGPTLTTHSFSHS